MLKEDKERMRSLVTETLTLLCKNGLSFHKQFTLNALIGINLDADKEFHFIISETIANTPEKKFQESDSESSDSSDDGDESSNTNQESDEAEQRKIVKSAMQRMQSEVMLDLDCQNSSEVRVKTEPQWDRNKNQDMEAATQPKLDAAVSSQHSGHWRVLDNTTESPESLLKGAKFYPLTPNSNTPADTSNAIWPQLNALSPEDTTLGQNLLDENWQQQNFPADFFQNGSYLNSFNLDNSFDLSGKSKRGRMKIPNTDERIGRKVLRCKGNVITVSKAQHVFNYGCRPTFQRIKEVMIILEQQGFGHMRMMEFNEKKTKIHQKAVKAMSFVKKPVDEVADMLAMYEISRDEYDWLYHGRTPT